jgi:type II secretory pathway pseudopilin PulG
MKTSPRSRGFTIAETLVVIGVVALMSIALIGAFAGYSGIVRSQQTEIGVVGSAKAVLSAVDRALLQSSRVLSSHNFSGTTYSSGTSTLVLEMPALDASGNTIPGTYDYVAFYASSTSAYHIVAPGSGSVRLAGTKRLSETLYSLSFTYSNPDFSLATSVDTDVQTRATINGRVVSAHLAQRTYLRNL